MSAGASHPVRVALRTNGEDDGFGAHSLTIGQRQREITLRARDFLNLSIFECVDLVAVGLKLPCFKDDFALASGKINVRTQVKLIGRRHDMLALLILINCIRQMIGLFEQNMRKAELGGARSRAQARWAGTDNGNPV